jgi:hypothetical protein
MLGPRMIDKAVCKNVWGLAPESMVNGTCEPSRNIRGADLGRAQILWVGRVRAEVEQEVVPPLLGAAWRLLLTVPTLHTTGAQKLIARAKRWRPWCLLGVLTEPVLWLPSSLMIQYQNVFMNSGPVYIDPFVDVRILLSGPIPNICGAQAKRTNWRPIFFNIMS